MASRDAFGDKFRQLLKDVPDNYTLEQWQHSYRQAIFLMGMQILERFESEAIAQQARHERLHAGGNEGDATAASVDGGVVIQTIASHGGGSGGGLNPSIFFPCRCTVFPDYPLALQAAATAGGRARSK